MRSLQKLHREFIQMSHLSLVTQCRGLVHHVLKSVLLVLQDISAVVVSQSPYCQEALAPAVVVFPGSSYFPEAALQLAKDPNGDLFCCSDMMPLCVSAWKVDRPELNMSPAAF